MSGTSTAVRWIGGIAAALVLIVLVVLTVVPRTDWAHRQARSALLDALREQVDGEVRVGEVRGNLLEEVILDDVIVEDSTGTPVIASERIRVRYALLPLLRQRIRVREVELVEPGVLLDRRPGSETWNLVALLATGDQETPADTATYGFGSWIRVEEASIRGGRITVRAPWEPPEDLEGPAVDSVVQEALSDRGRLRVEAVEGGYQVVRELRELDAELSDLVLADPEEPLSGVLASLSTTALPFRPPPLEIERLEGSFTVAADSVHVRDIVLELPDSRLLADGSLGRETGDADGSVEVERLTTSDLSWIDPELPVDGRIQLDVEMRRDGETTAITASGMEARIEGASLEGRLEAAVGDSLVPGDTDLRFGDLDTDLVERLLPDTELPVDGTLEGTVQLRPDGGAGTLVEAEVDFRERAGGTTSRLAADGGVSVARGVRFRDLRVHLDPLHLAVLRGVQPDLPVEGTVAGTVALDGAPDERLDVRADLAHEGGGSGRSALRAEGGIEMADAPVARDLAVTLDPLRVTALEPFTGALAAGGVLEGRLTLDGAPDVGISADLDLAHRDTTGLTRLVGRASLAPPGPERRVEVDLRAPELAFETVGAFLPAAGLRGSGQGAVSAAGPLSRLAVDVDLDVAQGGSMEATGTLDAERPGRRYALDVTLEELDASAASGRAPATDLTGRLALEGRGADPEAMEAELRAELTESMIDSLAPASADVSVAVRDGMVHVERADVGLRSARVRMNGTFGLAAGREGELDYRVEVDSLSDFQRLLPADTTTYPPRPALQAREEAAARADSLRRARETEVERAATGRPPPPSLDVDTVPSLGRDSLSGALRVEGRLMGGLERLGAGGQIELDDLVAMGARTSRGRVDFVVENLRSPRRTVIADAGFDSLRVGGFAFDSVGGRVDHVEAPDSGSGSASLVVVQDPDRDYRLTAGYTLQLDAGEVRLEEVALRFDTVRWVAPGPGTVRWSGDGVEVDALELRGDGGGRIFADGRFTGGENGDAPEDSLVLEVDDLQVSQILGILQDTLDVSGRLDLHLRASGPPENASATATITMEEPVYGGTPVPGLRARATYVPGDLEARAVLLRTDTMRRATGGAETNTPELRSPGPGPPPDTLLVAEGRAEVNPFDDAAAASRSIEARIRADSVPLDGLPRFTGAVSNVRGRLRGQLAVGGTLDEPEVDGEVGLDLGQLDLVPIGVELREVVGRLRVQGDSVLLDSLRARSRGGLLQMTGRADLGRDGGPRLDVEMTARDAEVLDAEIGQRIRIDGDLSVRGPYDSLAVEGEVAVREGVLIVPERRGDVVDLEDPLAQRVLAAFGVEPGEIAETNPLMRGLQVGVDVTISRNTWVRSSEGTAEIYTPEEGGPLRIRYDAGSGGLVLDGILNADRGEYEFAGRRFEISSGTATFLAQTSVDPLLHLTAVHEVPRPSREALTIQINVVGRLSEPRVVLSSNAEPPLSQTDLISYLVFGTSSPSLLQPGASGLTGGGGRQLGALATQQLASLAIGSLIDEAFASLETSASGSGLDVFRVEPADLPDELAFDGYLENLLRGTQVEVGKYLTRRFFLAARGRTTTETWPGLLMEYRMPSGIRWTASWEPQYLPSEPAFDPELRATRARVLGTFFFWERRGARGAPTGAGAGETIDPIDIDPVEIDGPEDDSPP